MRRDLDDDGRLNIFQSGLRLDQSEASFGIGLLHSCAILQDGISCWGDDAYSQLGDGNSTEADSNSPQLVWPSYTSPPSYTTP